MICCTICATVGNSFTILYVEPSNHQKNGYRKFGKLQRDFNHVDDIMVGVVRGIEIPAFTDPTCSRSTTDHISS